jgi:hypothetical protein
MKQCIATSIESVFASTFNSTTDRIGLKVVFDLLKGPEYPLPAFTPATLLVP